MGTNHHQQGVTKGFVLTFVLIGAMTAFAVYAYSLNAIVVEKFQARRWDLPARVYSSPLTLNAGSTISPKQLEAWLSLLDYSRTNSQNTGTYQKDQKNYTVYARSFDYGDGDKDVPRTLRIRFDGNKIVSVQGDSKNFARLEPIEIGKIYPESGEDRIIVSLKDTPPTLIDALIATEDRNFYGHHGVSIRGTMRAVINNFRGGSMQGGSTLTQQLIKNFYLNSERSLKRKVNEAIMAVLLESNYSKEDILNVYINEINLGQNGNQSINGFGLASHFYFNKPLSEIRLDQQALLVGIAKGSSYYNPRKHPERALARRNTVLKNMLTTGKIDEATYNEAINHDLDVVKDIKKVATAQPKFPDFLDYVRRELKHHYTAKDLQTAGLTIITTLNPIAQTAAEQAFRNKLGKQLQGALVSANPETGEIVALVGSRSEFTGFNRALDAKRQVGSLLKPVIYAMALETGRYNLASGVEDEPKNYDGWTPKNYSGTSHGVIPLTTALANSYNQAAVNTGMDIGMKHFVGYLNNLGIKGVPDYPSSFLGAVELSPMQMLGLYQVFANHGWQVPLHGIVSVIDEQGNKKQHNLDKKSINLIPESTAYLLNFALQEVVNNGTAKVAKPLGKVAGKTGTTNDARDAWFAGYSGNYVSVVWVGRDDNEPIGLTGSSGALPIWVDYMKYLPLKAIEDKMPKDIAWGHVEAITGRFTESGCNNVMYIPYKTGTVSQEPSDCMLESQAVSLDEGKTGYDETNGTDTGETIEEDTISEESDNAPAPSDEEVIDPSEVPEPANETETEADDVAVEEFEGERY